MREAVLEHYVEFKVVKPQRVNGVTENCF